MRDQSPIQSPASIRATALGRCDSYPAHLVLDEEMRERLFGYAAEFAEGGA